MAIHHTQTHSIGPAGGTKKITTILWHCVMMSRDLLLEMFADSELWQLQAIIVFNLFLSTGCIFFFIHQHNIKDKEKRNCGEGYSCDDYTGRGDMVGIMMGGVKRTKAGYQSSF